MVPWLDRLDLPALALAMAGAIAVALLAATLAARLRRQILRRPTAASEVDAEALKRELRRRLAEPGLHPAWAVAGAPTMGAGEAFESDIAVAAASALREAGGRRARAKELLRRRLDGRLPSGTRLNGSEALVWRQLGALSLLDSPAEALAAYAKAAELAPDDPEAQMLAGVLYLRVGNLELAEAAFRRQIALGAGPGGGVARYRGNTMLGDVMLARGDPAAAIAAYAEAQREVTGLLAEGPGQKGLRRDLSVTLDRQGDVLARRGELEAALECYRRSQEIAAALAAEEPGNPVWQHDLSVSHDRIGEVLDGLGDGAGALDSFARSLAIAEALAAREPDSEQRQWDLSASHDRIADVLIAQGRRREALRHYRKSLEVAAALAARDPADPGRQRDLAVSYHKLGAILTLDDPAEARELLEQGRAIIDRLARIAALQAQWRADLSRFDETLRSLDS